MFNILIILNWILKYIGVGDVGWINVAQDKGKWWAVVYAVMELCFIKCGEFLD